VTHRVKNKKSKHERERVSRLDVCDHREISAVRFGRGVYFHGVWSVGNQSAAVKSNPFTTILFAVKAQPLHCWRWIWTQSRVGISSHNPSIPRFKCIAKRRSHIILRILICHSIVRERWTLTLPIFGLVVVSVDERQDAVSSSNRSRPEDTWRVMQEKIHCN